MRLALCLVIAIAVAAGAGAQTETFDGAAVATSTACSTTGTGLPYNGWTNDPGDVGTSWRVWSGSTGSASTGPTGDLCGNGNYVYLETSCGSNPNVGGLLTPVFSAGGLAVPTVGFWYHMYGATMGMLEVQESDGQGNWTTVWSLMGDQGDQWRFQEVAINTFDVGNGPEAQVRFLGTRGGSFTSDMAVDEITFGNPAPPPANQPNALTASLTGNGTDCTTGGSCGVLGGPAVRTFVPGEVIEVTIGSGANGSQPFTLAHTPGAPLVQGPGVPTVAGSLDFSAAGFAALEFFVNGISGTSLLDQFLGATDVQGQRRFQFPMPPSGPTTLTTMQTLVADPTSVYGVRLTAALQLERSTTTVGLPPNFFGATPVGSTDDSTIQVVFSGFVFPFYGALYTDCWINSNGSVSFGTGGDTVYTESFTQLEGQEGRVAPWWDDFNPSTLGTHLYTEAPSNFVVTWTDVPEFGTTNANTFAVFLDQSGVIQFGYGSMDAIDGLVGIGPGNNAPGGPSNPTVGVNFTGATPGSLFGGPQDAIAQQFTSSPPVGGNPCMGSLTLLSFIPVSGGSIPGDLGYTAP